MSLFKIEDIKKKENPNGSKALAITGKSYAVIGKSNQKLEDIMWYPNEDDTIHFASMGNWSTHDLLFYFLKMTGPADVCFTTWSISEFAMRQLYSYVDTGMITKLSGLFDYRNGIHKPAELQFLKQITSDIKAAKCHAKVVVIRNLAWGISIVTSGNFTRNPRIEAGTVTNSTEIADFHKSWIENELNNNSDFERT